MMVTVLIAEHDPEMRKLLHMMLRGEYTLIDAPDENLAVRRLTTSSERIVALLGAWPYGKPAAGVLRACLDNPALRRHAYVLISMRYDDLSEPFRLLLQQLNVTLLPVPFDLDSFLAVIHDAAVSVGSRRKETSPQLDSAQR